MILPGFGAFFAPSSLHPEWLSMFHPALDALSHFTINGFVLTKQIAFRFKRVKRKSRRESRRVVDSRRPGQLDLCSSQCLFHRRNSDTGYPNHEE
jgi:hypothetical protein